MTDRERGEVHLYMEKGGLFEFPTPNEEKKWEQLGKEIGEALDGQPSEAERGDVLDFLRGLLGASRGKTDFTE